MIPPHGDRHSVELELMRASALLESDPAAAARLASAILAGSPGHPEAALLLATASQRSGDPAAARAQLESLVRAQPDSLTLQLELARSHAAGGRTTEAIAALQAALALNSGFADGWRELAAQRYLAGDEPGGDAAYGEYSRLATSPPELTDAALALSNRRFDAADALLRKVLKHSPDDVVALRLLATASSRRGDLFESEQLLRRCLELAPGYAEARFDLASDLYAQQRHKEMLPLVERLLATYPAEPSYMSLKAQAFRLAGRNAEAIAMMRRAIEANPSSAKLRLLHGYLLRDVGEQAQAVEAYRQALALQPGLGEAYWSLANLKTVRFSEADRKAMSEQLAVMAPLDSNRVTLEFALGKALEDAGQYAPSFEHYANGNNLQRSNVYHDAELFHDIVEQSKALYQPEFFAARPGWGSASAEPIFIVGMPRSGSTLLEQILASHSQVEGTRELPEMQAIVRDLMLAAAANNAGSYPELVGTLGRADIEANATRYLKWTASYRPLGRPCFIDKLLINFLNLGLIQLMFPRAIIIDTRRHPLGCCFSCYKQLFSRGLDFTYDQHELARYYRDYVSLMEHMDKVLP